jgi:hypothetical protein
VQKQVSLKLKNIARNTDNFVGAFNVKDEKDGQLWAWAQNECHTPTLRGRLSSRLTRQVKFRTHQSRWILLSVT